MKQVALLLCSNNTTTVSDFYKFANWLQHVCELTREVCETTVGETTRWRNDRLLFNEQNNNSAVFFVNLFAIPAQLRREMTKLTKIVWKDAKSIFQRRFHGRRHCRIVRSLFEGRTSTGSEVFSLTICLDAKKFVLISFFSLIKTIYPRFSTKPPPNDAKLPLPVDVRA